MDPHLLEHTSKISGILSLSIWLFAQLPQIIENHLNQSVEGVSLVFLLCWISGDVTNLIGCLLTKALPFQTCLAAYYCFIDCILSLQFWYYTRVYPKQKVHHNLLQSPNMMRKSPALLRRNRTKSPRTRAPRGGMAHKVLSATVVGSLVGTSHAAPIPALGLEEHTWLDNLLEKVREITSIIASNILPLLNIVRGLTSEDVGKCSAWLCSACYLSSRSPQIYKNYKLGSTQGISVFLFVFAMLGNSFYTISIVTDLYLLLLDQFLMDSGDFHKVLYDQLPFIVGSMGTIIFDTVIIFQCWYYNVPSLRPSSMIDLQEGFEFRSDMSGSLLHFQKPDWYTNNYRGVENLIDENTSLLFKLQPYYFGATPPPPPHYVAGSLQRGPRESPSLRHNKESPSYATLPRSTSVIPSIIGSYSAILKKLTDEAKIPFSPIDFLSDEFHVPVENSYERGRGISRSFSSTTSRR